MIESNFTELYQQAKLEQVFKVEKLQYIQKLLIASKKDIYSVEKTQINCDILEHMGQSRCRKGPKKRANKNTEVINEVVVRGSKTDQIVVSENAHAFKEATLYERCGI